MLVCSGRAQIDGTTACCLLLQAMCFRPQLAAGLDSECPSTAATKCRYLRNPKRAEARPWLKAEIKPCSLARAGEAVLLEQKHSHRIRLNRAKQVSQSAVFLCIDAETQFLPIGSVCGHKVLDSQVISLSHQ